MTDPNPDVLVVIENGIADIRYVKGTLIVAVIDLDSQSGHAALTVSGCTISCVKDDPPHGLFREEIHYDVPTDHAHAWLGKGVNFG